jgi:hypothetical protein
MSTVGMCRSFPPQPASYLCALCGGSEPDCQVDVELGQLAEDRSTRRKSLQIDVEVVMPSRIRDDAADAGFVTVVGNDNVVDPAIALVGPLGDHLRPGLPRGARGPGIRRQRRRHDEVGFVHVVGGKTVIGAVRPQKSR